MLQIRLFGEPGFWWQAEPFPLSARPKTVPLIAFLLLNRDQAIPRETLAFALWPDLPESDARANLRRHLHELQRALARTGSGEPWLLTDGEGIRWNPAAPWSCDVVEFEVRLAQPATRVEALPLYTADLLINLAEDWLGYHRERLRGLYISTLTNLAIEARGRRQFADALNYAEQLLAYDPLREPTVRQVMILRHDLGDRAGASQVFQQFVRRLKRDLGVDPMAETVSLHEAIRRQERPGGPPSQPVQAAVVARGETTRRPVDQRSGSTLPFVGRDAELEQLRAAWSRAARGYGSTVLIGGEAGIGKTRLITELARETEPEGARVLLGGSSIGEPAPFQAIIAALRSARGAIQELNLAPTWRRPLATLLPELHDDRTPAAVDGTGDVQHERQLLYQAVAHVITELARTRPMLIVFEDMHWAGNSTLDLIEAMARRIGRAPVLLGVTYREEETPRAHPLRVMRRRLLAEQLGAGLALSRLNETAVETAITEVIGDATHAATLARDLYLASDGNPFFLSELIRDRQEVSATAPSLAPASMSSDITRLPKTIQTTVTARFERLSGEGRVLAEVGAVIGPSFDLEIARETLRWSEEETFDALNELLDRHLVREAGDPDHPIYTFTHYLIQSVIYDLMPATSRQRRHRRIAQVMEDVAGDQLDELAASLATHFDRGAEPAQAAPYYARAARWALAVFADQAAREATIRALELSPSRADEVELLLLLEEIEGRAGNLEQQRRVVERLDNLSAALPDGDLKLQIRLRQVSFHWHTGDRAAEFATIAQLKRLAEQLNDPGRLARAVWLEGRHLVMLGRFEAARAAIEQALRLAAGADNEVTVLAHVLLTDALSGLGLLDAARQHIETAHELVVTVKDANQPISAAAGGQSLAMAVLRAAGRLAAAVRDFDWQWRIGEELMALAERYHHQRIKGPAHIHLGHAAHGLWQLGAAVHHNQLALAHFEALGDRRLEIVIVYNNARIHADLGLFDRAFELLQQAEAMNLEVNDRHRLALTRLTWAQTLADHGSLGAARELAVTTLDLARASQFRLIEAQLLGLLGDLERVGGAPTAGRDLAKAGLTLWQPNDHPSYTVPEQALAALIHVGAGDQAEARQLVDVAAARYPTIAKSIYRPERVLWRIAQTYHQLDDTAAARFWRDHANLVHQARLAKLADPGWRDAYAAIPAHQALRRAVETDTW